MLRSGQVLELKDLQSDEGCRGASAAILGLAEVKPDSSDTGQDASGLGCSSVLCGYRVT